MKFRYRIESRGLYIPQFLAGEEWKDFTVSVVTGQLQTIAEILGKYNSFGHNYWHFRPDSGQNLGDMSVFFENELKVCAFLGAAKAFFSDRTKEFEP